MSRKLPIRAKSMDEYLSCVPPRQRAALEKLRRAIRSAAPKAEECISYWLPAFRWGKWLVSFGATAETRSFYLMSSTVLADHRAAVKNLDLSKGTIRFSPEKPLSGVLVRKIVKARIVENNIPQGKSK